MTWGGGGRTPRLPLSGESESERRAGVHGVRRHALDSTAGTTMLKQADWGNGESLAAN
jgi:hypothetical protein